VTRKYCELERIVFDLYEDAIMTTTGIQQSGVKWNQRHVTSKQTPYCSTH
jgi:hypothetical protein